jgi:hypothetical protein
MTPRLLADKAIMARAIRPTEASMPTVTRLRVRWTRNVKSPLLVMTVRSW